MLWPMSISDSSHLCALALSLSFSGPVFAGQDSLADNASIDALVDELWDEKPPSDTSVSALELSLDAARSIGLANDLVLQGAAEMAEAARFRELGSWGAFDWIFNASAQVGHSRVEPATEFELDALGALGEARYDSNNRDLSLGFERAFSTGDSLSVSLAHNNRGTTPVSLFARNGNADVLSAAYTKPLLRGAGSEYGTSLQRIAGLRFDREAEGLRLQRQQLLLDIELKYWDLVLAQSQLEVAGSALDLSIEQLERDRRRREAGVATDVEVIQDEATVARRIEGVLLVETAVETRMDRLRSTLFPGVEEGSWAVRITPITAMPEVKPASASSEWDAEIQSALSLRREVAIAKLDVEIALAHHARAISEKRPSLDLMVQLGSQGYDDSVHRSIGEAFSYESPTIAGGFVYRLPMSNTSLDNEERAARAELRGARIGLEAIKSQVANEVREALRQVRYQSEASRAATKTREAAERLMAAERTRYEQGLATNFQVLEFQQALVEAQYSERAVLTAYCQALAQLEAARGGADGQSGTGVEAP